MRWTSAFGSALLLAALACGNNEQKAEPPAASTESSTSSMQDMQGMNMSTSAAMMNNVQSHMQMMEGAHGDSLTNMMRTYRPMADSLLTQFNHDMQQMNIASDVQWTALSDSVRQDLMQMPQMSTAAWQQHTGRMRSLMQMHGQMMQRK